ncbi:hypothetical protein [Pseudoxanthomonas indica]|uniref:Uncharacterized protein n=1 Tax=Pseudoxanthomonas indica TaxID=428993 RepID=A0A1T5JWJ3_9GAMM|nr:hypothetical protein [Pseudoxanthomonas indica]GGD44881.1 hypothetical protein GCM10007235_16030 [Pseudoxanthomonas indica]SKC55765.1 hypothetical protein SAMN06296058_1143 [Pseudoxanthomonas indica]
MNGTLSPVLLLALVAPQDRAITPQESDIARLRAAHRLSTTPGTSPAGTENVVMPATTAPASPSPSPRGGALAWLRGLWTALRPFAAPSDGAVVVDLAAADMVEDVPRLKLGTAGELRGFREFTAPRRMQLGGATPMRARAVGQRASLQRRRA